MVIQKISSEIEKYDLEQFDTFAGRYVDPQTGILHIGFTKEDPNVQEQLLSTLTKDEKEKVKFYAAQYSKKELEIRMDVFKDYIKSLSKKEYRSLGLVSTGFDPVPNKIRVVVSKETSKQTIRRISSIIGEEYVFVDTGELFRY